MPGDISQVPRRSDNTLFSWEAMCSKNTSYDNMGSLSPVTKEQFRALYDTFKLMDREPGTTTALLFQGRGDGEKQFNLLLDYLRQAFQIHCNPRMVFFNHPAKPTTLELSENQLTNILKGVKACKDCGNSYLETYGVGSGIAALFVALTCAGASGVLVKIGLGDLSSGGVLFVLAAVLVVLGAVMSSRVYEPPSKKIARKLVSHFETIEEAFSEKVAADTEHDDGREPPPLRAKGLVAA